MEAETALDEAARCLLAVHDQDGPLLSPMTHFFDGDAVWMTAVADAAVVAALRRDARCALAVPHGEDHPGVSAAGRARVFGPEDPLRLALHGPAIAGALAGLATRHAPALLGYAFDATTLLRRARHAAVPPGAWLPPQRVVLRVPLERVARAAVPPQPAGVAPPLPPAVPAPVRRQVGGRRQVTVAWDDGDLQLRPASWATGFALAFADGPVPPPGTRAAVAVLGGPAPAPGLAALVLHGTVDDRPALRVDRATWWTAFEPETVEVSGSSAPAVQLPD